MSDRHSISPYPIRMPAELREHLEKSAKDGNRSLHAEIISRLEASCFQESVSGLVDIVLDTDGLPISWDEIRAHVAGISREGKFNVYEQRVTVITPDLVSSQLRQEEAARIESFYRRTGRKPPKHLKKQDE
nr:Arc family DNA-binding protein [uncultured Pseudomonas sp.]